MRIDLWLAYGTLVAACLYAFRVLSVGMTYRYFWVNAWDEVLIFAGILAAHVLVRPRADPKFRKIAKRIVITTLVVVAVVLVFAFSIRIG